MANGSSFPGRRVRFGSPPATCVAGQYFTPCPLIEAIVEVMRPSPETTIYDPACGTGGLPLAAHDYV
jgi:type I restriction-modification system DNA methylase subunit